MKANFRGDWLRKFFYFRSVARFDRLSEGAGFGGNYGVLYEGARRMAEKPSFFVGYRYNLDVGRFYDFGHLQEKIILGPKNMDLKLPVEVAANYSSGSQRIRVMTEYWVNNSVFCPSCGNNLSNFENNKPVADFYCKRCSEEYELKSKQGVMGKKIVDGAYSTMIERLKSENNPNFFFLTYDKTTLEIKNFLTIPKYFFVPDIIEKRRALNVNARRAGWIGCNIDIKNIPDLGKIFYIQNGVVKSRNDVLGKWNKTEFVKSTHDVESKGWILDVLICVERIKKSNFSLDDVYNFESHLKAKHPSNNNVKAKIRQQLQFLRDKNVIEFVGRGQYRMKINKE